MKKYTDAQIVAVMKERGFLPAVAMLVKTGYSEQRARKKVWKLATSKQKK